MEKIAEQEDVHEAMLVDAACEVLRLVEQAMALRAALCGQHHFASSLAEPLLGDLPHSTYY